MALSETGDQQTRQNIHNIKINSIPLPSTGQDHAQESAAGEWAWAQLGAAFSASLPGPPPSPNTQDTQLVKRLFHISRKGSARERPGGDAADHVLGQGP